MNHVHMRPRTPNSKIQKKNQSNHLRESKIAIILLNLVMNSLSSREFDFQVDGKLISSIPSTYVSSGAGVVIRIYVLDNRCTIGIFSHPLHREYVMVLSSSAEFVLVLNRDSQTTYLTRFTPASIANMLIQLLKFRNTHSYTPYVCKRFPSDGDSTVDHILHQLRVEYPDRFLSLSNQNASKSKILWPCEPPLISSSGWTCHLSCDAVYGVFICPTGRRVLVRLPLFFDSEGVTERGTDSLPLEITATTFEFPITMLPSDIIELLRELSNNTSIQVITSALICRSCGASDAYKATKEFESLQLMVASMVESEYYPVGRVAFVEFFMGSTFSIQQSTANRVEVDVWIQNGHESDMFSICGDIITMRRGKTSKTIHLDLLLGSAEYSEDEMPLTSSALCRSVAKYKNYVIHALDFRKAYMASIGLSKLHLPQNLGLKHSDTVRNDFIEEFIAQGVKYVVIGGHTFRACIRDHILTYSSDNQTLRCIDSKGNIVSSRVPLNPIGTDPILLKCYQHIQAFVSWYECDPFQRQRLNNRINVGADLVSRSLFVNIHNEAMEKLSRGITMNSSDSEALVSMKTKLNRAKLVKVDLNQHHSRTVDAQILQCKLFLDKIV